MPGMNVTQRLVAHAREAGQTDPGTRVAPWQAMEIVVIASLVTLSLCALLSISSRSKSARVRKPRRDPLDSAVLHLIDEVTRQPVSRVNPSKRQTWV